MVCRSGQASAKRSAGSLSSFPFRGRKILKAPETWAKSIKKKRSRENLRLSGDTDLGGDVERPAGTSRAAFLSILMSVKERGRGARRSLLWLREERKRESQQKDNRRCPGKDSRRRRSKSTLGTEPSVTLVVVGRGKRESNRRSKKRPAGGGRKARG